jgi:hypothetical protein
LMELVVPFLSRKESSKLACVWMGGTKAAVSGDRQNSPTAHNSPFGKEQS